MQCPLYKNAIIIPIKNYRSGVFVDDECIPESLLYRNLGQVIYPGELTAPIDSIDEPHIIFAGYIFNHFGHFILESLSRLWFAKQNPDVPIVWVGGNLQGWQHEIFKLLGINNKMYFVRQPTTVRGKLAIPEVGYVIQTHFKEFHNQFLSSVTPSTLKQGRKAWVSRSKVTKGKLLNENRLEERLRNDDWIIYHPQDHSVIEQVHFLSSCECIAGLAGSAFHSLIFLKELQSKISLFSRDLPFSHNKNYETIARVKGFSQKQYDITHPNLSDAKLTLASVNKNVAWPNFSEVLDILSVEQKDNISSTSSAQDTVASRRINYLSNQLNLQRYLEIGVASGQTFFSSKIPHKVAVDPRMSFDYRKYRNNTFFETSSNTYFCNFAKDEEFDLIYLDGLHTFEQGFRDFCASLSLSHSKTIWIINATIPSDVFSAWPNPTEAYNFRKQARADGRWWHGDVFKVIFAIHDFFPMLDYVTIDSEEYAQTLVWKQSRGSFKPIFNDLGAIRRMSYFDMRKNIDFMRLMPEDKAFELVISSMGCSSSSHV